MGLGSFGGRDAVLPQIWFKDELVPGTDITARYWLNFLPEIKHRLAAPPLQQINFHSCAASFLFPSIPEINARDTAEPLKQVSNQLY